MLKLATLKKDETRGFTLVELIVTLVLFSLVVLVSVGILSSTLSTQSNIEAGLSDQIALRQAVLSITSDIRKNPEFDAANPLEARYEFDTTEEGLLLRADGSGAVATNIESFSIDTDSDPGRATITLRALGGQEVQTKIYLRVY